MRPVESIGSSDARLSAPIVARARHVMVVAGEPADWASTTASRWDELTTGLAATAAAHGFTTLTIRPYGPGSPSAGDVSDARPTQRSQTARTVRSVSADRPDVSTVTVIVNPETDGRQAFAAAVAGLPVGTPVTEASIAAALYAPADADPDLIVIAGPADRLPPSLMWELAYGELVFTDRPWDDLDGEVIGGAADEFGRRQRRFGGVG